MPSPSNGEVIADERQVTCILRVVMDKHGVAKYGELVDVASKHQSRFVGRSGLIETVSVWLSDQERRDWRTCGDRRE